MYFCAFVFLFIHWNSFLLPKMRGKLQFAMVSVDKNCRIQIQLFLYLLVGEFFYYFFHIPAYKCFSKSLSFWGAPVIVIIPVKLWVMLNPRSFTFYTRDRSEISKKQWKKQRQNNNSNNRRSAELFFIFAGDFESLCFKISRAKVAEPHIFYKATVVAVKKWSISLKYSNTDSFIKLYGNIILNIISLLSFFFV